MTNTIPTASVDLTPRQMDLLRQALKHSLQVRGFVAEPLRNEIDNLDALLAGRSTIVRGQIAAARVQYAGL